MNCKKCKNYYHKIDGTSNCYDGSLLNKGFYLKDNKFYPCDKNCLTCGNKRANKCLTCDKNKNLYLVENSYKCEYKNYSGYYLDNDNILKECYYSCKKCKESFSYSISQNKLNQLLQIRWK